VEDVVLDAWLAFARAGARLDELADAMPSRDVLVLSIYRPKTDALRRALGELRRTRHSLRTALGAMGNPDPALADETVAAGLARGKFANLNTVADAAGGAGAHWIVVVDDDVALPEGFLDRFLAVCEHLDLTMAQPAQTRASHAAWPVTRRRGGSMARETRFVEIGPVTCFRREAWGERARERPARPPVPPCVGAVPLRRDEAHVPHLDAVAHLAPRLAHETAKLASQGTHARPSGTAHGGRARERALQREHPHLGARVACGERLTVRPHPKHRIAPARVVLRNHADPHGRRWTRRVWETRMLSTNAWSARNQRASSMASSEE